MLTLAHGRDDAATASWQAPILASLARGFADTRAVVVKPTSLVTTLADRLLPGTGKACLLWVDLQTWLATMLRDEELKAGVFDTEGLRLDGFAFEAGHHRRRAPGPRLAGRAVALARLAADPDLAPRLLDLDFAQVLADPADGSARLAAHYGLDVPADWAQRIGESKLLSRYAKDDAVHFDAQARRRELAAAAARHADAIAEGLAWAEGAIGRLGGVDSGSGQLMERLRPRS